MFLLGVVVFAVFGQTAYFDFLNWDDPLNITENPLLHPLTASHLWEFWRRPYAHLYVPVTSMSWAMDWAIGGGKPAMFHLTNVALHTGSAVLAALLFHQIVERLGLAAGRWALNAACVGALVFAIHPLQAEPVAWVTSRKDVLSNSLVILYLYVHCGASAGRWNRARQTEIVVLLLALLAKPSAVVAGPMAVALGRFVLRRSWRHAIESCAVALGLSLVWALAAGRAQPVPEWLLAETGWRRLWVLPYTTAHYVRMLIWPAGLAPLYGVRPLDVAQQGLTVGAWLWLGVLGTATIACLRRGGALAAGALWWLIAQFPTSGIVPFLYQDMSVIADRYVSLALLGPGLAVSFGMCHPIFRRGTRGEATWLAVRVALTGLGVWTFIAAGWWADSVTLWTRATKVAPRSAEAWLQLGDALKRKNEWMGAEKMFRKAAELRPGLGEAHNAVGLALLQREAVGEAVVAFSRADEAYAKTQPREPVRAQALTNLAAAYLRIGRPADAAEAARRAAAIQPTSAAHHANLGFALQALGDKPGARAAFQKAIDVQPGAAEAAIAREQLTRL